MCGTQRRLANPTAIHRCTGATLTLLIKIGCLDLQQPLLISTDPNFRLSCEHSYSISHWKPHPVFLLSLMVLYAFVNPCLDSCSDFYLLSLPLVFPAPFHFAYCCQMFRLYLLDDLMFSVMFTVGFYPSGPGVYSSNDVWPLVDIPYLKILPTKPLNQLRHCVFVFCCWGNKLPKF